MSSPPPPTSPPPAPPPSRRRGWLVALLLLLVLPPMIPVGLLAHHQGRAALTRWLSHHLSTPERTLTLDGLNVDRHGRLQLRRFAVADPKGVWLEGETLRLSWSWSSLLNGEIHLRLLSLERLNLVRPPVAESAATDGGGGTSTDDGAQAAFPPVEIHRLSVTRVELGQPVLGEDVALEIYGKGGWNGIGMNADLEVIRVDRLGSFFLGRATWDPGAGWLGVDVQGRVDPVLSGALMGRPGVPLGEGMAFDLKGSGPVSDWRGDLTGQIPSVGRLAGTLDLGGDARAPAFKLSGTFHPAAELHASAPLLEESVLLARGVWQRQERRWVLERGFLNGGWFELDGVGSWDGTRGMDFAAHGRVTRPEVLTGTGRPPLSGVLQAQARLSGFPSTPTAGLTLTGEGVGLGKEGVESLRVHLALGQSDGVMQLSGTGHVNGVRVQGRPLPEPDWQARLAARQVGDGAWRVEGMALTGAEARLEAQGDLTPGGGAGALVAHLPDVKRWRDLTGGAFGGGVRLNAPFSVAWHGGVAQGAFKLNWEGAQGVPPALLTLLGREPELRGRVAWEGGVDRLRVEALALEGEGMRVDGGWTLHPGAGRMDGGLTVSVPSLTPLSTAVGAKVAGAVEVRLRGEGPLERPEFQLTGAVRDPRWAENGAKRLGWAITSSGPLATPGGRLVVQLDGAGGELSLTSGYAWREGVLTLEDWSVRTAGLTAGGGVIVATAPLALTGGGGFQGDLSRLRAWLGDERVQGRLQGRVELTQRENRQHLRVEAEGEGVTAGAIRLARTTVRLDGSDLLGQPQWRGDGRLLGVALGSQRADEVVLAVEGRAAHPWDLAFSWRGPDGQLSATGAARSENGAESLHLERLQGQWGGKKVVLRNAPVLAWRAGETSLDGVDLTWGRAALTASGRLDPWRVTGEVDLRLPLEQIPLAEDDAPMAGELRARGHLSGTPTQPVMEWELKGEGLRWTRFEGEAPPARLDASLRMQPTSWQGEVKLSGWTPEPTRARLEVPVTWSLMPWTWTLRERAPLHGTMTGRVDLARLPPLLDPAEHRLAGVLEMNLLLTGPAGAPVVEGAAELKGGAYEQGGLGMVLKAVEARLEGKGNQVRLVRASARDGRKGELRASGLLSLAGPNPTVTADVDLSHFALMQGEALQLVAGGKIVLSGAWPALSLTGGIEVERADFTIPEGHGGEVRAIPVRLARESMPPPPTEAVQPGGGDRLALDLGVNVPGRAYVRGRGLDSEWQGQIRVQGTAAQPRIQGRLEVKRGQVDALGNRFQLKKSALLFEGESPPNPQLDITAGMRKEEIEAMVRLRGPARNPRLSLESDPPLPQEEILTRLFYEKESVEMTPGQALRVADAMQQLQGGGMDLMGKMRRVLGMDRLDVGSDAAGGERVKTGKYLSDKVFLEVEKGLTMDSGGASVEVELSPRMSLDVGIRESGTSGVNLNWKKDY